MRPRGPHRRSAPEPAPSPGAPRARSPPPPACCTAWAPVTCLWQRIADPMAVSKKAKDHKCCATHISLNTTFGISVPRREWNRRAGSSSRGILLFPFCSWRGLLPSEPPPSPPPFLRPCPPGGRRRRREHPEWPTGAGQGAEIGALRAAGAGGAEAGRAGAERSFCQDFPSLP